MRIALAADDGEVDTDATNVHNNRTEHPVHDHTATTEHVSKTPRNNNNVTLDHNVDVTAKITTQQIAHRPTDDIDSDTVDHGPGTLPHDNQKVVQATDRKRCGHSRILRLPSLNLCQNDDLDLDTNTHQK